MSTNEMYPCLTCNKPIAVNAKVCPYCGEKVNSILVSLKRKPNTTLFSIGCGILAILIDYIFTFTETNKLIGICFKDPSGACCSVPTMTFIFTLVFCVGYIVGYIIGIIFKFDKK